MQTFGFFESRGAVRYCLRGARPTAMHDPRMLRRGCLGAPWPATMRAPSIQTRPRQAQASLPCLSRGPIGSGDVAGAMRRWFLSYNSQDFGLVQGLEARLRAM